MDLVRVGRAVRALRRRRGWRQDDAGRAAGVSGSTVGRIERGTAESVPIRVLDEVVRALGGTLDVTLRSGGADLDRLLDAGHARLVETVVRLLRSHGWDVAVEVSFSIYGERGSIDVVGRHPSTGALLIVEVKAAVGEAHGTLAVLDRKERLAPRIAREHGWPVSVLGTVLIIEDTRTNRRRIEAHRATFAAALPAATREVRAWLRDPSGPLRGVMFLSSVQGVRPAGGLDTPAAVSRGRPRSTVLGDRATGSPRAPGSGTR